MMEALSTKTGIELTMLATVVLLAVGFRMIIQDRDLGRVAFGIFLMAAPVALLLFEAYRALS